MSLLRSFSRAAAVLSVLATTVFLQGCILVVENDDFGRHRLYGTTWYLEVLVISGHRHRPHHSGYGISFRSDGEMSGTAGCASFTADYDLTDDQISVSRVRTSTFGCERDEIGELFIDSLPDLVSFDQRDDRLDVRARRDVEMVFVR